MHIESTYPLWLVLPLVALAVFVGWMVYFRRQEESVLNKPVRMLLGISRFAVLLVVGLLIISPWIRTIVKRQDKPWYLIIQDNSRSVPPTGDQSVFRENRIKLIETLTESLDNRFQVMPVLFGSGISTGTECAFSDPVTDPGDLFNYLRTFSQTHDLAGAFITTDGVATKGLTFSEAAKNFPYPVTVLATGDSTRFPDVRIQDVVSNEWVRKNSLFPVRIYYNTGEYSGAEFKLQILGAKGILGEQVIRTAAREAPYAEFLIQAPEKGTMQLEARIIPDQPDKNQDNNFRKFIVRVIEQEGEILCLYEAAHPDIDAFVQAFQGSSALNVTVMAASLFKAAEKDYDLIILHGLPSVRNPMSEFIRQSAEKQIPLLFVISQSTEPVLFNRINHGMVIDNRRKSSEAAQGTPNTTFSFFTLPEDFKNHLNTWPPLDLSFETYQMDPGTQILFRQKILSLDLPDPLVAFSNTGGIKYGFFCGEGIWRWRLHEFREQKNHDYFDDWLSRTVQYLMLNEKREKFRVVIPEEFYAFSSIRISAHLLNNSLEPVNDPDVLFTVTDSAGQKTEFQMGRVNDYYELNINGFAPGVYRYSAITALGSENFGNEGMMEMTTRQVEQANPAADFASLRTIATRTNGKFYTSGEENSLITFMNELRPPEIRIRKEFKWYDLINFNWLLGILIFLLAMEWFLRRWFGIR